MNMIKRGIFAVAAVAALSFCGQAFAGDTVELIDAGTFEVDPTFTLDNMHKDGKPCVDTEVSVVYGVMDGFNLGTTIGFGSSNGLNGIAAALGLNALLTPVETDNFSLDVMVDFGLDMADDGGYSITPSVELNYDLEPDQALWGIYARIGLPISGMLAFDDDDNDDVKGADVGLSFTLGTYYTIMEGHQLFLEGGFDVANLAENFGKTDTESAFISLGYNVEITDSFELTTELAFNIPSNDEEVFNAALTIGGIFSIGNSKE